MEIFCLIVKHQNIVIHLLFYTNYITHTKYTVRMDMTKTVQIIQL